jgi:GH24 family phage-related lysozyme (muramidase)
MRVNDNPEEKTLSDRATGAFSKMKNAFGGMGKMFGKKENLSEVDENKKELFTTLSIDQVTPLSKGETVSNIAAKIYNLVRREGKEEKKERKKELRGSKEEEGLKKTRHKEIVNALLGKGKFKSKIKEPKLEAPKAKKPAPGKPSAPKPGKPSAPTPAPTPAPKSGKPPEPTPAPTPAPKSGKPPAPTPAPAPAPKIEPAPPKVIPSIPTAAKVAAGVTSAAVAGDVLASIKKNESFSNKAYHDPKKDVSGKIVLDAYSVGYGHQITQNEIKNGFIEIPGKKIPVLGDLGRDTVLSQEDASALAEKDFGKYYNATKKITNFDKLNYGAQKALIDMTYNMGEFWYYDKNGKPKWPSLDAALMNLDMEQAAQTIINSKYYKDVGKRAKENVELIRKGVDNVPVKNTKGNLGDNLNQSSTQNADMKKDLSGQQSPIIVNNNTNVNHIDNTVTTPMQRKDDSTAYTGNKK